MLSRDIGERGASAVIIAASFVLLLAMAAVAIDLGAGFNERRQDQTSADVGVLAGAIDALDLGECGAAPATADDGGCNELLTFVQQNLTASFTGPEWIDIWRTCQDPSKPTGFGPLPVDTANGWTGFTGFRWDGQAFPDTVDCVSVSQGELRVRVPDQLTETSFAQVIGFNNLTTNAVAQARIIQSAGARPIIPFGITAGTAGESCILQPAAGIADPPCTGGTTGNFGAVLSQVWGSPQSNSDCSPSSWVPGTDTIAFHTANGMDHPINDIDPPDLAMLPGTADSFSAAVRNAGGQNGNPTADRIAINDRCTLIGGAVVNWDATVGPANDTAAVNTLYIDTGASAGADALVGFITGDSSDFPQSTVPGFQARIRHGDCSISPPGSVCLDLGSQGNHRVDNTPLWTYLVAGTLASSYNDSSGTPCGAGAVDNSDEMSCVLQSADLTSVIFTDAILNSKRFSWVPEFYYASWGTGTHWQPVEKFTVAYISNFWFDPPGPGLVEWEAGQASPGPYAINQNGLKAVSAMLVPDVAVSSNVLTSCPSCVGAEFETELTR